MVKVGVSAVDIAGARKNVESEIPEWDFDKVRKDARTAWNNYLSKIDITTSDKEDKNNILHRSVSYGHQPESVYGCRRTLSRHGP